MTLNHLEAGVQTMIDLELTETWLLYGLAALIHLEVEGSVTLAGASTDLDEWSDLTLSTLIGSEVSLSKSMRIYSEYSFTEHQSTAGLAFTRHMVMTGLRYTYQ